MSTKRKHSPNQDRLPSMLNIPSPSRQLLQELASASPQETGFGGGLSDFVDLTTSNSPSPNSGNRDEVMEDADIGEEVEMLASQVDRTKIKKNLPSTTSAEDQSALETDATTTSGYINIPKQTRQALFGWDDPKEPQIVSKRDIANVIELATEFEQFLGALKYLIHDSRDDEVRKIDESVQLYHVEKPVIETVGEKGFVRSYVKTDVAQFVLGLPSPDLMKMNNIDVCSFCEEDFCVQGMDDDGEDAAKLPCGHIFGRTCLFIWFSEIGIRHNCCPHCKVMVPIKRPEPRPDLDPSNERGLFNDVLYLMDRMPPMDITGTDMGMPFYWHQLAEDLRARLDRREARYVKKQVESATGGRQVKRQQLYEKLRSRLAPENRDLVWSMKQLDAVLLAFEGDEETESFAWRILQESIVKEVQEQGSLEAFNELLIAAIITGQCERIREAEIRLLDPKLCDCNVEGIVTADEDTSPCKNRAHSESDFKARLEHWVGRVGLDPTKDLPTDFLDLSREETLLHKEMRALIRRPVFDSLSAMDVSQDGVHFFWTVRSILENNDGWEFETSRPCLQVSEAQPLSETR